MAALTVPSVEMFGDLDPQELPVENIGLRGLNGDHKIKILPNGYTMDSLPRSSVSLLAVGSRKGFYAAGGRDGFVLGTTDSLREAFSSRQEDYKPQLTVPAGPLSHVAFNADESCLIVALDAGGIVVYFLDALLSEGAGAAPFTQIGSHGQQLREVKPNPAVPEMVAVVTMNGELMMLSLNNREFVNGPNGSPVLQDGVSTMAWSKHGRQLVCGLGDGTGLQMTPQGEGKGMLPAPPDLENYFMSSIIWVENHIFLTTHTPVPGNTSGGDSVFHALGRIPQGAAYQKISDPSPPFGIQERAPPYFFNVRLTSNYEPNLKDLIVMVSTYGTDVGMIVRFKDAEQSAPADTHVTVSPSEDTRRATIPLSEGMEDTSAIGMALDLSSKTPTKRPLNLDEPEESYGPLPAVLVMNHEGFLAAWNIIYDNAIRDKKRYVGMMVYAEDHSVPSTPQQPVRATLPAAASPFATPRSATFGQTSALEPGPALASPFSALPEGATSAFGSSSARWSASPQKSTFGMSAFAPKASTWGQTPTSSPTPNSASTPSFGSISQLGSNSPFGSGGPLISQQSGSTPALGAAARAPSMPGFGTVSALGGSGPAFGAPSQLGATQAFGKSATLGAPTYGQPAFGQTSAPSGKPALGGSLGSPGMSSGFGAYANKGGFATAANMAPSGASPFGSGKSFASGGSTPSVFGSANNSTFGSGNSGFRLTSAFKADPSAVEGNKSSDDTKGSLGSLGMGLGSVLNAPSSAMDVSTPKEEPHKPTNVFAQPKSTASPFASISTGSVPSQGVQDGPIKSVFGSGSAFGSTSSTASAFSGGAKIASAFTTPSATDSQLRGAGAIPNNAFRSTLGENPFEKPEAKPATSPIRSAFAPQPTPVAGSTPPESAPLTPSSSFEPRIKTESPSDEGVDENALSAPPLPPDIITRPSYAPGSTSSGSTAAPELSSSSDQSPPVSSSVEEEAPLPPDFAATSKEVEKEKLPTLPGQLSPTSPQVKEEVPLPPDFTIVPKETEKEKLPSLPERSLPTTPPVEEGASLPHSIALPKETGKQTPPGSPVKEGASLPHSIALPEGTGKQTPPGSSVEEVPPPSDFVVVPKETRKEVSPSSPKQSLPTRPSVEEGGSFPHLIALPNETGKEVPPSSPRKPPPSLPRKSPPSSPRKSPPGSPRRSALSSPRESPPSSPVKEAPLPPDFVVIPKETEKETPEQSLPTRPPVEEGASFPHLIALPKEAEKGVPPSSPRKSSPSSPVKEAPLPLDFVVIPKETEKEAPEQSLPTRPPVEEGASFPHLIALPKEAEKGVPPSSPRKSPPSSPVEEVPLPPGFVVVPKETEKEELPPLPAEDEGSDEADDERDDKHEETPSPKKQLGKPASESTFPSTPEKSTQKPASDEKSGVFSSGASYSNTFKDGVQKDAPFSRFFETQNTGDIESEDDEEQDEDELSDPEEIDGEEAEDEREEDSGTEVARSISKSKSPKASAKSPRAPKPPKPSKIFSRKGGTFDRSSTGARSASQTKLPSAKRNAPSILPTTKKEEVKKEESKPNLFGTTSEDPFGATKALSLASPVNLNANKPTPSVFGPTAHKPPGLFSSSPSFAFGVEQRHPASPTLKPSPFLSARPGLSFTPQQPLTPQVSKPSTPAPVPTAPASPAIPVKDEDVESVVDFDREYDDEQTEKIREQLMNGEAKPCETLPPMRRMTDAPVPEEFNEVFDSIYLSGNIMINKLGQVARDLKGYHIYQNTSPADITHNTPEDMLEPDSWRLCEARMIGTLADELLKKVQAITAERPLLEKKRQAAAKGFIKLDTQEAEVRRRFAVHTNPSAAESVRYRGLAPEQQLQQRALRKLFTRVDDQLREAEKAATLLKAKIAARDRNHSQPKIQPPTVEAVRNTVMKLTAMAEKKSADLDYLEERMRRVRMRSRSVSRSVGTTPVREGTPQRAPRPVAASTPVLAVVEEEEVVEVGEERRRRRERGRKVRQAMEKRGGRVTAK